MDRLPISCRDRDCIAGKGTTAVVLIDYFKQPKRHMHGVGTGLNKGDQGKDRASPLCACLCDRTGAHLQAPRQRQHLEIVLDPTARRVGSRMVLFVLFELLCLSLASLRLARTSGRKGQTQIETAGRLRRRVQGQWVGGLQEKMAWGKNKPRNKPRVKESSLFPPDSTRPLLAEPRL